MVNKLAFRNAKRSMGDYLVYLLTMTVVAAMMFAFKLSDLFKRYPEHVLPGNGTGCHAGICNLFYHIDRCLADPLHGKIHAGKTEPGICRLSFNRPEEKTAFRHVYEGRICSSALLRLSSVWRREHCSSRSL